MKNIKQIREELEVLKEKDQGEDRKIATLVRAGLFDAKKLPMLKRALDKDNAKVSPAERKVLLDLLDSLMSQVMQNKGVYQKIRQSLQSKDEHDIQEAIDKKDTVIPNLLILQRKNIRQFPDGVVALYYARKIDKYVSIPFFEPSTPAIIAEEKVSVSSNIKKLKSIKEDSAAEELVFEDGNKYTVNSSMANKIVGVYESMNRKNKKKMEKMLNESVDSFNKVMNFAVRQ